MEVIPVIQCIIVMVYVCIYVNIWPIGRLGSTDRYKAMATLDGIVTFLMIVTAAPIQVIIIIGVVFIKDLILIWYSG